MTCVPLGKWTLKSVGQFSVAGWSAPVPNVSDAPIATKRYAGRCVAVATAPGLLPEGALDDFPNPQPDSKKAAKRAQANHCARRIIENGEEEGYLQD